MWHYPSPDPGATDTLFDTFQGVGQGLASAWNSISNFAHSIWSGLAAGVGNLFSGSEAPSEEASFADDPGFPSTPTPNTGGGWLEGVKTGLGVLSIAPGPVGSVANLLSAGISFAQGNYAEAGIAAAGIALSFVGAGVAAKAIQLARQAKRCQPIERFIIGLN